ncbi:hypothetical protein B0H13DRAFT_1907318 [Mycena leptocephala]|nr:hypothetical protein B0H13DRAFT_1907318 [Mycena leptocephala]
MSKESRSISLKNGRGAAAFSAFVLPSSAETDSLENHLSITVMLTEVNSHAPNEWVLFIHKVAPHLAKKEFEAKLERMIDELAQLPVIQKSLLKIEMLFQNDRLDHHGKALGIAPAEPVVLVMAQSETAAQLITRPRGSQGFRTRDGSCLYGGTCFFGVDVVPKVDSGVTPSGGIHVVGFYNVPRQVSFEQHVQNHHALSDNLIALPAMQKHFRKWQYNKYLDDAIQRFGYPAPFVYRAESKGSNTPRTVTEVLPFFEATGTTSLLSSSGGKIRVFPALSRFLNATNLIMTVTTRTKKATQRNGRAVTVTVAPLQLGTFEINRNAVLSAPWE